MTEDDTENETPDESGDTATDAADAAENAAGVERNNAASPSSSGKKLDPKPFFVIGIVAVIAVGGWLILGLGGGGHEYPQFASCLADEGATMYGFDACPHCNAQKNHIGQQAFKQNLSARGYYVECRPQSEANEELGDRADKISSVEPLSPDTTQGEACQMNVGAGTPTWVIDGKKYVGEQSLRTLAEATGCSLPAGYQDTGNVGGFTNTTGGQ